MDSPGLAALERLSDEELLTDLAGAHKELTETYATFSSLVEFRRTVTRILSGRGVSQRKIAERLGVSQAAVASYMKGVK